jgi:Protein of unknown function (DUF3445)
VPSLLVQSSAVGTVAPGWLGELSLRAEPPWLSMGTRAVRWAPLLEAAGAERDHVRRRKEELLLSAHDLVSVAVPGAEAAAHEAARLVAGVTGGPLDGSRPPLETAALLVPDDLVVLLRSAGAWRMAAGVVCFPSHWSPADKLGLPVTAIHGPVPHYAEELGDRVDRFLDRLSPDRPVWRRNWTVHASPELHAPHPVTSPVPVAYQDHWLRSERQVLVALPRSAGVLFTIRTEQVAMATLSEHPRIATRLAKALRSTPPELAAYRFGTLDVDGLAAWLERQAAISIDAEPGGLELASEREQFN